MIASSGSIASSCICPVLPTAHWISTQFRLRQELDPNASSPRNAPIAPSVHRLGFTVVTSSRLALRLLIFPADLRLGSWKFSTRFDQLRLIFLFVASQLFVDAYSNCDWLYSLYLVDEFATQRDLGRERSWRTSRFWFILCEHDPTDIEALKLLIELRRVSKRVSYMPCRLYNRYWSGIQTLPPQGSRLAYELYLLDILCHPCQRLLKPYLEHALHMTLGLVLSWFDIRLIIGKGPHFVHPQGSTSNSEYLHKNMNTTPRPLCINNLEHNGTKIRLTSATRSKYFFMSRARGNRWVLSLFCSAFQIHFAVWGCVLLNTQCVRHYGYAWSYLLVGL